MKKFSKPALIVALCALTITQTGCYGEFALVRKVYEWNGSVSPNKFVKSLLFWGLTIIPVYGVAAFIDAVILNLIEFWSGTNPVSMNEGDHEMQMVTFKGDKYMMEATKDTFTTTQLSGTQAGEVRIMKFDRTTLTWKYTDSKVCEQPVMTFLDDQAENIRVYTENGTMDLTAAELQDKGLLLARVKQCTGEAMAAAN